MITDIPYRAKPTAIVVGMRKTTANMSNMNPVLGMAKKENIRTKDEIMMRETRREGHIASFKIPFFFPRGTYFLLRITRRKSMNRPTKKRTTTAQDGISRPELSASL